jgi:hypothetical protein
VAGKSEKKHYETLNQSSFASIALQTLLIAPGLEMAWTNCLRRFKKKQPVWASGLVAVMLDNNRLSQQ